ncbi:MAG TPA: hypothetical protein VHO66_04795, partial [Ruminiclostridium sp.]|nr:hypothetical protein [Ruminiclostridium sp.]
PWFYSNYIHLVCNKEFNENFFDFFSICSVLNGSKWIDSIYPGIPWINRNSIENYIINQCDTDLNEIVLSALDNDNYIVTFLDEFYLPDRIAFQKEHFLHENFIYGFDTEEKVYYILGFTQTGKFISSKISFDEFRQSYDNQIKFLKFNNDFSYDLDLSVIIDSLQEYLESKDISLKTTMLRNKLKNCVYGMAVYNELIRYLQLLSDEKALFDIRPFHILWEHKKCMVLRINYILEKYGRDYDLTTWKDIESKCLFIRNMLIKYYIAKKKTLLDKCITAINEVSIKEEKAIKDLIAFLKTLEPAQE